jgi:hypothetical protein
MIDREKKRRERQRTRKIEKEMQYIYNTMQCNTQYNAMQYNVNTMYNTIQCST